MPQSAGLDHAGGKGKMGGGEYRYFRYRVSVVSAGSWGGGGGVFEITSPVVL